MWLLLLSALIAGVATQLPTPCAGPSSFTARFRRVDKDLKYYVDGKMFYDAKNRRIREFEFEEVGREKMVFDKLILYNLNTEYSVDLKTRKCNVTTPHPSIWKPYGVPPEGRFRGEGTLGAVGVPNEEVTIALFDGKLQNGDDFFATVTQPSCFLVEFGVFGKEFGFFHIEFFDVISGITDPNAFVPPRECVQ